MILIQTISRNILVWLGILGGITTLLSHIQNLIELAKWADFIVQAWKNVLLPAFEGIFGLINITPNQTSISMILMAIFISAIAIGTRVGEQITGRVSINNNDIKISLINFNVLIAIILYILQNLTFFLVYRNKFITNIYLNHEYLFMGANYLMYCGAIIIGLKFWPKWCALIVAISMIIISYIFGHTSHLESEQNISDELSTAIAALCAIASGLLVVAIAPPVAFTNRIIFMMVGTAAVVALSTSYQSYMAGY
jgi:hypothetical protein